MSNARKESPSTIEQASPVPVQNKKQSLFADGHSGYTHQVFISHRGTQKKEVAFPIMAIFSYFCDPQFAAYDEVTLTLGDDNRTALSDALSRSAHCLVLISKDFFESKWTVAEVDAFLAAQESAKEPRKLIPLFVDILPHDCRSLDMSQYRDKHGNEIQPYEIQHRKVLAKSLGDTNGYHPGEGELLRDFVLKHMPNLMENELRGKRSALLPEFRNHVDPELLAYVYDKAIIYYDKVKGKVNAANLDEFIRDIKTNAPQNSHAMEVQYRIKQEQEKHAQKAEEKKLKELAARLLQTVPEPLENAIDRQSLLAEITVSLEARAKKGNSPIQIIQGMGGLGKTQLAIMYANSKKAETGFICWVYADNIQLPRKWLELGEALLGRDVLRSLPEEERPQAVTKALMAHEHWLLVLDKIENEAAFKKLIPSRLLPTQRVLVTTRNQNWKQDHYPPMIRVLPFTPDECQTYFQTRLSPQQGKGSEELAQALGSLPLAIAHAVAYMQQTEKTAQAYLKLFQEKGIALLAKGEEKSDADENNYNATVLMTYQLSMEVLGQKNPQAAELLKGCAYFYPEGIKKSFLKKLLNLDEEAFDDCMRAIREYSLLSKGNTGFNMHRLVQQVIRYQLKEEEREVQMTRVVQCLTELHPDENDNAAEEQRKKAFMPHLEAIITHHAQSAIENEQLALALGQLGNIYLYLLGQPKKSVSLYERALKIFEAYYGREHYQVASTLMNLGNAYGELGKTARQRDLLERALIIQEAHYGREHYQVASTLMNLGNAYSALGKTARQRDLLERTLKIQEAHYGREHHQVAITLGSLGNAYGMLGNAARKRDLLERALKIFEAHYGQEHHQVAITLGSLGNAYGALGETARQRDLLERALKIFEAHYGQEHHQVAITLGSLGLAYNDLGDAARARNFLERALKIQEVHYGREHYEVALTLMNLGNAYGDLGKTTCQRDLLERALKIQEAHYGREHYQVAITLVNLSNAYGALGDTARKRDLLKRALKIQEAHYGWEHYEVAITLTNLSVAYHWLKQQSTALQTAQHAYRILMNHPQCGADHPRTKQCIGILQSGCQLTLEDLRGRQATPFNSNLSSYRNKYKMPLIAEIDLELLFSILFLRSINIDFLLFFSKHFAESAASVEKWKKHIHSHSCPFRFFSLRDVVIFSLINKVSRISVNKEIDHASLSINDLSVTTLMP
ncbi:MAG: symbB [Gammaproteobacteria bacterium]|jgi:tetratricopeptide (TPR) repeat protein|nr:symbB [Gammaproteobacteria bacterium]